MSRFFDFIEDEEKFFEKAAQRKARRESAAASVDPDFAQRLEESAKTSPWMRGPAHVALTRAGVAPSSPAYKKAAEAAAKRESKKGLGWHSVGDFVNAAAGVSSTATRGAVRALTTALSAPYEEAQAGIRNAASQGRLGSAAVGVGPLGLLGAAAGWAAGDEVEGEAKPFQSSAAVAIGSLVKGDRVDLGTGFFPGGDVRKEQVRRARSVQIGGRSLTPGRLLATSVTEPGTKPYTVLSGFVDAAAAVADPAAKGLKVAGQARAAHKFFTATDAAEAGLVRGRRPAVIAEQVERWIDSPKATKLAEKLAEDTDFLSIWRRTGKKVPVDVVLKLKDAGDPVAVKQVLRESVLGGQIREKIGAGPLSDIGLTVKRQTGQVRLLQQMPGNHVDMSDPDRAVETIDRFLRNAKVDDATISGHLETVARARFGPERLEALKPVMESVESALKAHGMDAPDARRATTMFLNSFEDMRRYFVDAIGRNEIVPGTVIGANGEPIASPHLFAEYLNKVVPLPDARDIRRTVSAFAPVFKVPGVKESIAFADFMQNSVWKFFALARGAWTVRVVGEEQGRMAVSGLDSAFKHPISYIAYVTGRKGSTGITGDPLDDAEEFLQAMSRGSAGWRNSEPGRVVTSAKRIVQRGEDVYAESWADELGQMAGDPVASKIAAEGVDAVREWFWSGPGQMFRKSLETAEPQFGNRLFADAWLDSVAKRISIKTGGDPDLLDVVRTGKFNGARVVGPDTKTSKDFLAALAAKAEAGVGPAAVKGDVILSGSVGRTAEAAAAWDKAVEATFNVLMSKPTNRLSRSPAFKQFYWRRMAEVIAFGDAKAQRAAIANAKKAGMTKADIDALQKAVPADADGLNLDQLDAIAKAFALDETKKLLFDLSNRSQFSDITRIIFPFAEAWREIMTTWARLGTQNPQIIRRGQQLVEGARGAGFFYTDPQTGEEVFAYPGTEWLNEQVTGVPTPFVGSVQGLNMAGSSIFPALGPVLQIPASKIIPNKPDWKWAREFAMPFGEPDMSQGVMESQLPAWAKKLQKWFSDPESDRVFANTVIDTARYLVSTGEYSTGSQEELDRLMVDATRKARYLYVMRGLVQFGAPTAPRPVAVAEVDGKTVVAQTLLDDFQKMQKEDYDSAVGRFLDKYGEDALLYMQGKTKSLVGKLPMDQEGIDWVRENPKIAKKYPLAFGFFAPTGGEFSFDAYNQYLDEGKIHPLTPEENAKLANSTVAWMIYRQAKAKVGNSKEEAAWLRDVKAALEEEYPGFGETLMIPQKAKPEEVVKQLEKAANDPALADTDTAKALKLYFKARSQAMASAKAAGLASFTKADKAAPVREWLRQVAAAIDEEYPGFSEVFDRGLAPEMKDDEPVAEEEEQ